MRYERWHRRDLIYSLWHRNLPDYCKAIDADWIEFCHNCSMPLAGIEVALDVGQPYKPTTVTRNLGLLSNRPTYLTLYTPAEEALEHHKDPQHMPEKHPVEYYKDAIESVRIQRLSPTLDPEKKGDFYTMSGEKYGRFIQNIHSKCKFCGYEATVL